MVKTRNSKPTAKQKLAVKNIVVNLGTGGSIKSALLKSGYKELTAKNPVNVLESKGFKELSEQAGLTDIMILTALADDIKQKPRDRSKELAIACKVKGLYKADNDQQSAPIQIADADFIEIIRAYRVRDKGLIEP